MPTTPKWHLPLAHTDPVSSTTHIWSQDLDTEGYSRLFHPWLFRLSFLPSGLTWNGPISIKAPKPKDEHLGPTNPETTVGEGETHALSTCVVARLLTKQAYPFLRWAREWGA
jgi:hypothetical protein